MGIFNFFKSTSHTEELTKQAAAQTAANQAPIAGELLRVEDVFSIAGQGIIATGTAKATVSVGQSVIIQKAANGETIPSSIARVEAFRQSLQTANAGDQVGVLLANVDQSQVARGDIIIAT